MPAHLHLVLNLAIALPSVGDLSHRSLIVGRIQVPYNVDKNKDNLGAARYISIEIGFAFYSGLFARSTHLLPVLVPPATGLIPLGCPRLQIICDASANSATEVNTNKPSGHWSHPLYWKW